MKQFVFLEKLYGVIVNFKHYFNLNATVFSIYLSFSHVLVRRLILSENSLDNLIIVLYSLYETEVWETLILTGKL